MSTSPRSYDSPRRRAAAEQTRRRIVDAAGRLFSDTGYAATSIRAIAGAAGTSPENVYLVFGTKAALLAAWIDVSIVGDDAPIPFVDRPEARRLAGLATFDERLNAALSLSIAVNARVAIPLAVLDAAAQSDPGIAELAATLDAARCHDIAQLLGVVLGDVPVREDLTRTEIVDLVAALLSVHSYRALVLTAGWSVRRYAQELAAQVRQAVLPSHVVRAVVGGAE